LAFKYLNIILIILEAISACASSFGCIVFIVCLCDVLKEFKSLKKRKTPKSLFCPSLLSCGPAQPPSLFFLVSAQLLSQPAAQKP
jgi:hypothetical protein